MPVIRADYTSALTQSAGIGRCTRELLTALRQRLPPDYQMTLFASRDARACPQLPYSLRHLPLTERQGIIAWQRLQLPLPIDPFVGRADLWHFPDYLVMPTLSGKKVLTVHDLSFFVMPQFAHQKLQQFLAKAVPRSIEKADHIIADSESTRRDIINLLGTPAERISVVHCGVDSRFHPIVDQEKLASVRRKYGLPLHFFVFVGRLEPRKNVAWLIKLFSRWKERYPDLPHELVIAGGKGWDYEPIFVAAEASSKSDQIHFIGFVDDADLPALLSLAQALVYPSHYEGFGLPPLEAMACGTPVLVSNRASLPEVVGEAGFVLPLEDDTLWEEALYRLVAEPGVREGFVREGLVRVQGYSWDAAAGCVLSVYRVVL